MPPNDHLEMKRGLRVAIIGQSVFAADVFERLRYHGHQIVGVFTILDKGKREDPLAAIARTNDVPVFKIKAWRRKGEPIPEVLEQYRSVHADLNILPYCSQFIPMEVINYPRLQSICYHPSILPRHRGASAISWTLICGDNKAGLSIFWADDGLDTGPILLQEICTVDINDTVDSLYKRFLYPVGVSACAQAVDMVADGSAPRTPQLEHGATYEAMLNKPELQKIDWTKTGLELHNFIRGMDSVPGASCQITIPETTEPQEALLFGSSIWGQTKPEGTEIIISGMSAPGVVHEEGLLLTGSDGNRNGHWAACNNFIINDKMNAKVWDLFYQADAVRTMLTRLIREESLRTYLFTYSHVYDSISMATLASMFELDRSVVHSTISKMIINEELMASLDDPTQTVVMHRSEPSRLQSLALQLTDKVNNFVDSNERIFEMKQGNFFIRGTNQGAFRGDRQNYRGGQNQEWNRNRRDRNARDY